jgi:hypothetical protein
MIRQSVQYHQMPSMKRPNMAHFQPSPYQRLADEPRRISKAFRQGNSLQPCSQATLIGFGVCNLHVLGEPPAKALKQGGLGSG